MLIRTFHANQAYPQEIADSYIHQGSFTREFWGPLPVYLPSSLHEPTLPSISSLPPLSDIPFLSKRLTTDRLLLWSCSVHRKRLGRVEARRRRQRRAASAQLNSLSKAPSE
ncbi:hypothetical protein EVAR_37536_1 [Eumeta japonica]|uniref:Uncharacterized protein n=1 Tax=Eumeta variegata TaxID=151549 RepID=A0A4C1XU28_EUMVA|nr:hypothetical protein EVAR_37536_1 [Eumeta japonica]